MTRCFAGAALGGWLLALCFPLTGLDFLAWISFVPLLYAIDRARTARDAALFAWSFGFVFFLFDVGWTLDTLMIHGHFGRVPALILFLALISFLGLFPALFGFVLARIASVGFSIAAAAPFVWTALEYVRSWAFTGFPWDLVGYSQVEHIVLAQVADVTGVYGMTFVVVLVNATLWEIIRRMAKREALPWAHVAAAAGTVVLIVVYGEVRMADYPAYKQGRSDFVIGVLQANIPQKIKWAPGAREHTFLAYEKLGKRAVEHGARLLVWPETSVPVLFGSDHPATRRPSRISHRLGVPMLIGAPSKRVGEGREDYFNSAFLVEGSSFRHRYDKIHLVPFGEYMPFNRLLPLGPGIAAREADYSPGHEMTVMRVPGCPSFSVLICYEAIFPSLARLAVNSGAHVLMNMTNDGWFGPTAAPYQHLNMARLRSIENRAWLIRSANTGVSAAYDPAGRLIDHIALDREGWFVVAVPAAAHAGSPYSSVGDLFAWGCLVSSVILAIGPLGVIGAARRHSQWRRGRAQWGSSDSSS